MTTEEIYQKSGYPQPKDKWDESKKQFDYWDMIAFADYVQEKKLASDGDVSVSDSSDFELQRLFDWLQEPKREPAQTKFTAGMTRNVAREFEYLLKHSR